MRHSISVKHEKAGLSVIISIRMHLPSSESESTCAICI